MFWGRSTLSTSVRPRACNHSTRVFPHAHALVYQDLSDSHCNSLIFFFNYNMIFFLHLFFFPILIVRLEINSFSSSLTPNSYFSVELRLFFTWTATSDRTYLSCTLTVTLYVLIRNFFAVVANENNKKDKNFMSSFRQRVEVFQTWFINILGPERGSPI